MSLEYNIRFTFSIDSMWNCAFCSSWSPDTSRSCTTCFSARQPCTWLCRTCTFINNDGKQVCEVCGSSLAHKGPGFLPGNKCSVSAFLRGCYFLRTRFPKEYQYLPPYDTDDEHIRQFLEALDSEQFFDSGRSKLRGELIRGETVGDDIFSSLATWFDVHVVIVYPDREYSVGNASKKNYFKISWCLSGGEGHWYFVNPDLQPY